MDGRTNGQSDRQSDRRTDGWLDKQWRDGWTDRQRVGMDGQWRERWTDGQRTLCKDASKNDVLVSLYSTQYNSKKEILLDREMYEWRELKLIFREEHPKPSTLVKRANKASELKQEELLRVLSYAGHRKIVAIVLHRPHSRHKWLIQGTSSNKNCKGQKK